MELIMTLLPWIWGSIFVITLIIELETADIDAIWFSVGALVALIVNLFCPTLDLV